MISALLLVGPTGDGQGRNLAQYQPATLAGMEALFDTQPGAPLVIIGQPDVENQKIDNAIQVPRILSFLSYRKWSAEVKGLNSFPKEDWPSNIPLLYYSYHVMVGLGTIFMAVLAIATFLLWRGKLYGSKWMLWVLMLSFPFPYIANTAGWMTAEIGRQPWLVYGVLRTVEGFSKTVSAGNAWFTLLGFMGMYTLLSILFIFLVWRELEKGPEEHVEPQLFPARAVAAEAR
jgi:cytochrome d ubiquinol oxidase subunit I